MRKISASRTRNDSLARIAIEALAREGGISAKLVAELFIAHTERARIQSAHLIAEERSAQREWVERHLRERDRSLQDVLGVKVEDVRKAREQYESDRQRMLDWGRRLEEVEKAIAYLANQAGK